VTNNLLEGSEFLSQVVHSSEAVCVMSLNHTLAARAVIDASDLQHYPLISLERGDALEEELRKVRADIGLTVSPAIETTYSATICAFAAQGLGLGVVNPYMAVVFRDRIAIRRFTPLITVKTYVTFARFSPTSELADRFVEALNSRMRSSEWAAPFKPREAARRRARGTSTNRTP
jgi:DNA-binding transcriptional LysR family regulator